MGGPARPVWYRTAPPRRAGTQARRVDAVTGEGDGGGVIGAVASFVPCRLCGAPLRRTVIDLGMSPLCESFLAADQLDQMEPFYPLHVRVCDACHLVQLAEYVAPEAIFTEYAYFSSFSDARSSKRPASTRSRPSQRLGLGQDSHVVEIASNDGYLLQHLRGYGHPGPRHRACRERGADGDRAGHPDQDRVLRRRHGRRAGGGGTVRRSRASRTTSSPRPPTSTTSSPGWSGSWRRTAWLRSSSRT